MKRVICLLVCVCSLFLCACDIQRVPVLSAKPSASEMTLSGLGEPSKQYGSPDSLTHTSSSLNASMIFPVGDLKAPDETIRGWTQALLDKMENQAVYEKGTPAQLSATYNSYLYGSRYAGVIEIATFSSSWLAQPTEDAFAVNIDILNGKVLSCEDIFRKNSFSEIAKQIKEALTGQGIALPESEIPDEKWLSYPVITDQGIRFVFPCGEILSGSLGTLSCLLPYSACEGWLLLEADDVKPEKRPAGIGIALCREQDVILRSAPTIGSEKVSLLRQGDPVEILDQPDADGWQRVWDRGKEGYIKHDLISHSDEATSIAICTATEAACREVDTSNIIGFTQAGDSYAVLSGPNSLGYVKIWFHDRPALLRSVYLRALGENAEASPSSSSVPAPSQSASAPVVQNGSMIALTFDDGPSKNTARLLDLLEKYDAHATFCVVGSRVSDYDKTLVRIASLGNEIASHTYHHKKLSSLTADEIRQELADTNDAVFRITGVTPKWLRPPYGSCGGEVKLVCQQLGMGIVNWSVDTDDWKTKDPQKTYEAIMASAKDGSIILCHDLYSQTADAMELAIPELIARGYRLVTVSELITRNGDAIEAGKLYRKG